MNIKDESKKLKFIFLFIFVSLFILITSCRRDDVYEGNDIILTFSTDTLTFDTVFTQIGSATRIIKAFNPKNLPVKVNISLENQTNSFFRFNADGVKGPLAKDIEINAQDSIYIFVETTIDPDAPVSVSPFVIEDKLLFDINGNQQIVYLEAWGQNANYIPGPNRKGSRALLSCNFGQITWNDPKPYVIYGILYVDSCQLVLPAGTKLYVHGGVVRTPESIENDGLLVFLKHGRLLSQGTFEQPVIIQGDRLEPKFVDVKNQWVGLLFWQESRGNILRHTTIKNSIIGLRADSMAQVTLNSCKIFNTGNAGIISRFGDVSADNCLLYNNDGNGLQLIMGGNYKFNYCTIASYIGQSEALVLADFYCPETPCPQDKLIVKPVNATFNNCIFAGSGKDEIAFGQLGNPLNFKYMMHNCIVKVENLLMPNQFPNFFDNCTDCYNLNQFDRLFLKQSEYDFRLDTMSVALGKAKFLSNVLIDIEEKTRKTTNPDPGCYEF